MKKLTCALLLLSCTLSHAGFDDAIALPIKGVIILLPLKNLNPWQTKVMLPLNIT